MKIESGIDIPESKHSRIAGEAKYPFKQMDVGQSVYYEGLTYDSPPMRAAKVYGPRLGFKFAGRNVEGGLRIWRIE